LAARNDRADREIDLHGYTAVEARSRLNTLWSTREWQGLQRIRVIHGTGSVLHALVKLWCEEKGVAWTVEAHNPGVTIVHPGRRLQAITAPPHRPLQKLKGHLPAAKRRDRANPAPDPDSGLSDEELMAREFARLGGENVGEILRGKRSTDPGPYTAGPQGAGTQAESNPEPSEQGSPPPLDAMAQEFERLGEETPLVLFKRKRDLMPPREAPEGSERESVSSRKPAPRQPAPDLMAQEFARLGEEPPGVTRKRKRG
jgi:hypothetical protein